MFIKKSLINNWANALLEVAIEEKKVDIFHDQLLIIKQIFRENLEYKKLLSIHESSDDIRETLLDEVFKSKDFDILIINTLKLIVKRDLITHIDEICKESIARLNRISDKLYGTVWSAIELEEKYIKKIEEKLSKKYNTNVILINKVKPELIGGIRVIVNGENYDGTIAGKLDDIKHEILDQKIGIRGD